MPVFRTGGQLHYYAHVPKCGGSSVEAYLTSRFGSLAFVDTRHLDQLEARHWTRSSPQHVTVADFRRLVPADWIASSFAVVRHPVKRLVSAFRFQVEVEGTVAALWSVDEWFDDWLKRAGEEPFLYDNHLRPQSEIVPQDATIFRIEEGLDRIVPHLDALAGNADGARMIPAENVRKKSIGPDAARLKPSAETLARIGVCYAEDFRRFGYGLHDEAPMPSIPAPKGGLMGRLAKTFKGKRT
ncbi:sulfotransferase family 2 domain-containing protein [Defluviimonas sp. D31]|uniref:sulfotransferase family 2 domain-containing protein n=1 Tax=Defluviimonas sp. D31 TaxID=3083253 RepID=UPI00296E921B|nr:sulfotransferase family 2 domain-containing protein [Defluviimonas sp. D31]MDW4549514.1 sulfotransferase family 2 domain-containing protein [Defluviimonas sp. D31]